MYTKTKSYRKQWYNYNVLYLISLYYCQLETWKIYNHKPTFIIAPCPPGKYSLTGHEPCQECPLHYYQDDKAQTTCTECDESKRTEGVGRNSSSSCVAIGMYYQKIK